MPSSCLPSENSLYVVKVTHNDLSNRSTKLFATVFNAIFYEGTI
jgi:hypothetical protein